MCLKFFLRRMLGEKASRTLLSVVESSPSCDLRQFAQCLCAMPVFFLSVKQGLKHPASLRIEGSTWNSTWHKAIIQSMFFLSRKYPEMLITGLGLLGLCVSNPPSIYPRKQCFRGVFRISCDSPSTSVSSTLKRG